MSSVVFDLPERCEECSHPLVARKVHVVSERVDRNVRHDGVLTDVVDIVVTVEMVPHLHGDVVISTSPGVALRG